MLHSGHRQDHTSDRRPTEPLRAEHGATSGVAGHPDLLTIARRIRSAVEHDDTEGLHAELTRLRTALMEHVHAERAQLDMLADPAAALVLDGQRRLLRLLTDVLFDTADRRGDDCNCLLRAAEIEVALRRQVRVEAALLPRHPDARPGTGG